MCFQNKKNSSFMLKLLIFVFKIKCKLIGKAKTQMLSSTKQYLKSTNKKN